MCLQRNMNSVPPPQEHKLDFLLHDYTRNLCNQRKVNLNHDNSADNKREDMTEETQRSKTRWERTETEDLGNRTRRKGQGNG